MYANSKAFKHVEFYEEDALAGELAEEATGKWHEAPSMGEARCALGVACSFDTDHLFAAGGYGGMHRYLDTAERLDLSAGACGRWEPLPQMSCKRAGCNAVVGPDHRIYVLGGGPNGKDAHDTMEALDPREPRWQSGFPPLRAARHFNAAAFGPDGRLYVSGAYRHTGQLDAVERYDPRLNAWEDLPNIGVPIEFSAGVVIF